VRTSLTFRIDYLLKRMHQQKPEWLEVPDPSLVDPRQRLSMGADIITDYPGFLQGVADWIRKGQGSPRTGLACNAIRLASSVWIGVGVYTICEIFFLAGMWILGSQFRFPAWAIIDISTRSLSVLA
jgi:hypothetical protein